MSSDNLTLSYLPMWWNSKKIDWELCIKKLEWLKEHIFDFIGVWNIRLRTREINFFNEIFGIAHKFYCIEDYEICNKYLNLLLKTIVNRKDNLSSCYKAKGIKWKHCSLRNI